VFGLWLFEEDDRQRIYNLLEEYDLVENGPDYSRLNAQARIPQAYNTPPPEEPTSQKIEVNSLFANPSSIPEAEEPSAEQLPSVDRLSQLFSHALTMQ
jgi:hypothetical protein